MLSNPPPSANNLHLRQRQHRRQNSTPTAFDAVKIAPLPKFHQQQQRQHVSHRRGLSLDAQCRQLSPSTPARASTRQDVITVSTSTTNSTGFTTTTPQHVLREAQQQRIGRPGPEPVPFGGAHEAEENFLLSPHPTPHSHRFLNAAATQCHMPSLGGPFDPYGSPGNGMTPRQQPHFGHSHSNSFSSIASSSSEQDLDLFANDSNLSTPAYLNFPDSSPIRPPQHGWASEGDTPSGQPQRTMRRISNGIMDRVARFESMGSAMEAVSPLQRPMTPPQQNVANHFPPTPVETPHNRVVEQPSSSRLNRFCGDYDESMEETIRPTRAKRSGRQSPDVFQEFRQQAEAAAQTPVRPSNTAAAYHSMQHGLPTPGFAGVSHEFAKLEQGLHSLRPHTLDVGPDLYHQGSPMTPQMAGFATSDDTPHGRADFRYHTRLSPHSAAPEGPSGMQSPAGRSSPWRGASSHRRTESIASVTSAASIASINIDETKTETGVTLDDIAVFIDGPDPADGRWTCRYDECGKKFGRKENIKSHVQTHLNDRQYQCPTCKKCFVRQHDLKRHAKIHTGIKPYPCECGNSFARHDALTRHRQRGMCVGAFDGIVRKVVKRGRPRKVRPDAEDRKDKRERTRRKNNAAAAAASSSATSSPSSRGSRSEYSDISAPNSPGNELDGTLDERAFPDMMAASIGPVPTVVGVPTTATMDPTELAVLSAPMPSMRVGLDVRDALPVMGARPVHSPSEASTFSRISQASIGGGGGGYGDEHDSDGPRTCPGSPAKSVASHYTHQPGTPPELSASSSPPANCAGSGFFGLDGHVSGLSDGSLGLGGGGMGGMGGSGVSLEDDMLLFARDNGLLQLDRDLGLGGKFEEDYDAVAMFTDNDDMFFGNA